ncbi:hypothetical protein GALL_276620 [mine drainage metagenome]|uniref:AAA+ ATPase domain-containing protein n=1 Tax=mine drainage metagenome TaxID=410659 RepID=A0A1J5RE83_9ZZZZ
MQSIPEFQNLKFDSRDFSKWSDPTYIANYDELIQMRDAAKLPIKTASFITAEPTKWVYPNFLAEGELSILIGSPGVGKTTFTCYLAAGVTQGKDYYQPIKCLRPTGSGHVIVINREDSWSKTLIHRFQVAGADINKVHFIDCSAGGEPFSFANDRDINRLLGLAKKLKNNIGLIIIDPIYFAVDGDPNNNFKAREAYERLSKLAKLLSCAILGIGHAVKNTLGRDLLGRVAGPPALREVARGILYLSKIKNGPSEIGGTHVMTHLKNNIGSMDGGVEYRIKGVEIAGQDDPIQTSMIDITRELYGSAEDILKNADDSKPVEIISKLTTAIDFLQKILKDEPLLLIDIEKQAEKVNIKKGTLMNAKKTLRIVCKKQKGDGRSLWYLPDTKINDDILCDNH